MATYSNYFTGGVDELRFYKGACTDEEILAQFIADGGVIVVSPTDMIAHWPLNDTVTSSSSPVVDVIGGVNGVFYGVSNTSVTGQVGTALDIPANNGLGTATSAIFNAASFTVSFWVNSAALTTGNTQPSLAWNYNALTGYFAEIDKVTGRVRLAVGSGAAVPYVVESTTDVIDSTWHMVTLNYSSAAQTAIVYIDGVAEDTATSIVHAPPTASRLVLTSRGNGAYEYTGKIDQYKFFDRAISAEEVTAMYTADGGV